MRGIERFDHPVQRGRMRRGEGAEFAVGRGFVGEIPTEHRRMGGERSDEASDVRLIDGPDERTRDLEEHLHSRGACGVEVRAHVGVRRVGHDGVHVFGRDRLDRAAERQRVVPADREPEIGRRDRRLREDLRSRRAAERKRAQRDGAERREDDREAG